MRTRERGNSEIGRAKPCRVAAEETGEEWCPEVALHVHAA